MNAAVVETFNSPPRYSTFPDPIPNENEILVNVTAAGLHQVVRALANGTHYGSSGILPFIPGVDGTGRLEDGSRVYFGMSRPPYGTFAERTLTSPHTCIPLPDALEDAAAAGLANPAMSSWAALKVRARFTPGESVLILGATGTAGHLAVQIARRLGARRIVAVGRNPEALAQLSALGADATISLNEPEEKLVTSFRDEIAANGVDVILDYLWGSPAEILLQAIAKKGLQHASTRIRYIQIGSSAAATIALPAATLRSSGLELLGSGFGSASMAEILQSVREFFDAAAQQPFQFHFQAAPLSDIEKLWNQPGERCVFLPSESTTAGNSR